MSYFFISKTQLTNEEFRQCQALKSKYWQSQTLNLQDLEGRLHLKLRVLEMTTATTNFKRRQNQALKHITAVLLRMEVAVVTRFSWFIALFWLLYRFSVAYTTP